MLYSDLKLKMEEQGTPIPEDSARFWECLSDFNLQVEQKDQISVKEFITSSDATVLLPRVIQGTLREAAEPVMLLKQFFQTIRFAYGNTVEFPAVSAMVAGDIGEGQDYPKAIVDFALFKNIQVRVGKYGLMFGATDEAIRDSLWDVIGIMTRGAGRAMARWEEQKRANAFHTHAHIRFDGNATTGGSMPTGYGYDPSAAPGSGFGSLTRNGTLSTFDWIDMISTLLANDMTPTDILMHPLYWPAYVKTLFVGGLGNVSRRWNPRDIPVGEGAISEAMPFAINVQLSPRIHFNRMTKKGDIYVVDSSELGVELVQEEMTTEEWREERADIRNVKVRAYKGWGVLNHGRAIVVAKNVTAAETYDPTVQFVHQV